MKIIILFSILLFVGLFLIPDSFGQSNDLFCKDGKTLVYRINADKYACLNPPTADRWYESGIAEPVEQLTSEHITHPEKMTSSAPLPDAAKGPQIDFF